MTTMEVEQVLRSPLSLSALSKRHSAVAAAGESLMLTGEGKWRKDPLYYNLLQDKNTYSYLTAPSVLQLLKNRAWWPV